MKFVRKLATLVKALARQPMPRPKKRERPLPDKVPETLTDEHVMAPEGSQEHPRQGEALEQERVADLLRRQAGSQDTQSQQSEKGE